MRVRDLGYLPGVNPTGKTNSILDVPGVGISQVTLPTSSNAESIAQQQPGKPCAKKGVTVLLARPKHQAYHPASAGVHIFNGNGELTGRGQINDWGYINMPIVLTNSYSLGVCYDGAQDFIRELHESQGADLRAMSRHYGTPVVAETADWWINSDIKETKIKAETVAECFQGIKTLAEGGQVFEGSYGGGAGMTCHEFTAGTGTSSRVVGSGSGGEQYTLGVLVQSNYGHRRMLSIGGVPIGKLLLKDLEQKSTSAPESESKAGRTDAGSLVVIIMTDAPLLPHSLERLARHATAGVAQVGTYGIGKTHSGDIFLAVSTAEHPSELLEGSGYKIGSTVQSTQIGSIKNESIDMFFECVAEAVEEAILNSMVGAREGMVGLDGSFIEGLPVDRVKELLDRHLVHV